MLNLKGRKQIWPPKWYGKDNETFLNVGIITINGRKYQHWVDISPDQVKVEVK